MHVNELKTVLITRWKFVLLPSVAAALIAALVVLQMPKTYESCSMIRIGNAGGRPFETTLMLAEVMRTQTMLEELSMRVYGDASLKHVLQLKNSTSYQDKDMLVKVRSTSGDPAEAQRIAQALTEQIVARYRNKYEEAQSVRTELTVYVRENMRSNAIVDGMERLVIVPTRVEVQPEKPVLPLKSRKKEIVVAAFLLVLVINSMIALYLNDRQQ